MVHFFSRLRYSFGNEDWKTEEQALSIRSKDQVLCITASGDRPLNLLVHDFHKMVCVDANAAQNYLFQLKLAAMQTLDYSEYLAFLGAVPGKKRKDVLQKILPHLSPGAAQFWLKHERMIDKGILYQGSVERLTKIIAKVAGFVRGKKIRRLFAIDCIEEQREFVQKEWNSYLWRKLFDILLNPFVSPFIIKDPGLTNLGSKIKAGSYLYERIHTSLERELAKKSPLLSLLLKGKVSPEAFPPYLTQEGTQVIKTRHQNLEVHTGDIITYLERVAEPTFDVFSLSDVASYLSYPCFVRLLNNILKTAKPGARFCLRQFLSSYEIPIHLQPFFVRNIDLEQQLEKQDNCFVYRFLVGAIHPQQK